MLARHSWHPSTELSPEQRISDAQEPKSLLSQQKSTHGDSKLPERPLEPSNNKTQGTEIKPRASIMEISRITELPAMTNSVSPLNESTYHSQGESNSASSTPQRNMESDSTGHMQLVRSLSEGECNRNWTSNAKLSWNVVKKNIQKRYLGKTHRRIKSSPGPVDNTAIDCLDPFAIAVPTILLSMVSLASSDFVGKDIRILPQLLKITVECEVIENARRSYIISLSYGGHSSSHWTVKREIWEILNLHSKVRFSTIGTKQAIPRFPKEVFQIDRFALKNPERQIESNTASGTAIRIGSIANSIWNPKSHRENSKSFQKRRCAQLEEYLKKLFTAFFFRKEFIFICKFLEISALGIQLTSFGDFHGKEGFTKIIEVKGTEGWLLNCSLKHLIKRRSLKWTLVRSSFIVFTEGVEKIDVSDVFMFDSSFEIIHNISSRDKAKKSKATGLKDLSFQLKNKERMVKLSALSEKNLISFCNDIAKAKENCPWTKPNRFDSFAPIRQNCAIQWLVDARDYYWNLSRAIYYAKECIYIHDWWLSPELYLRRPAYLCKEWRLDKLLQRKANEGVQIFVVLYNNFGGAIPIDSLYTKKRLTSLSSNIYVLRSPSHLRQNTFFWAHHEKICVIDNSICFLGGLDLCFGRYDFSQHVLVDISSNTESELKETNEELKNGYIDPLRHIWPGKDYSNARVRDFFSLDQPFEDMYDRSKVPRMGWHDVHLQMKGQIARDAARHFVQRWNYILRHKSSNKQKPFLVPPPEFTIKELEDLDYLGSCEAQILRSSGLWSLGLVNETEQSILNAYVSVIENSEHFIYMENQFFITSTTCDGTDITNQVGDAIVKRIIKAHEEKKKWKAFILIPLMPGFQNSLDAIDGTSVRLIMNAQYKSICRGQRSIFQRLKDRGINAKDYIGFYSLRAWGKINSDHFVTEMVYIHGKCLIADDKVSIVGSANVNERSMRGNRDSELAIIVRDTEMVDSVIDNKPYKAGHFSRSLRLRLMREHLGFDTDKIELEQPSMNGLSQFNKKWQNKENWEPKSTNVKREVNKLPKFNEDFDSSPNEDTVKSAIELFKHLKASESELSTSLETTSSQSLTISTESTVSQPDFFHSFTKAIPIKGTLPKSYETHLSEEADNLQANSSFLEDPTTPLRQGKPKEKHQPHYGSGVLYPDITMKWENVISKVQIPEFGPDSIIDVLSDDFAQNIWQFIAQSNTDIYRKCFYCIPDDEVKTWHHYRDYQSKSQSMMRLQGIEVNREKSPDKQTKVSGPPGANIIVEEMQAFSSTGKVKRYSLEDESPNEKNLRSTDEITEFPEMKELLGAIRGHLVIWPTEFLANEDENNSLLFGVDRIPPLDIYD